MKRRHISTWTFFVRMINSYLRSQLNLSSHATFLTRAIFISEIRLDGVIELVIALLVQRADTYLSVPHPNWLWRRRHCCPLRLARISSGV